MKYRLNGDRWFPIDEGKNLPACRISIDEVKQFREDLSLRNISKFLSSAEESYNITFYIPAKTEECRIPVSEILEIQSLLSSLFSYTYSDIYREYSKGFNDPDSLYQSETNKIVIYVSGISQDSAYSLADYISDAISRLTKTYIRYMIVPAGAGESSEGVERSKQESRNTESV